MRRDAEGAARKTTEKKAQKQRGVKMRPRPGAAAKACEGVLQLLFPLRCPVCDDIVTPQGERICLECLGRLQLLTPPWCMKCGKKLAQDV